MYLFSVSKLYEFESAHVLEVSCASAECERLHGHSYKVDITISGRELNDEEMLVNFNELDAVVKPEVERLDHRLLASTDQVARINNRRNLGVDPSDAALPGRLHEAWVFTAERNTTAEKLSQFFCNIVSDWLLSRDDGNRFSAVTVKVNETRKCAATCTRTFNGVSE